MRESSNLLKRLWKYCTSLLDDELDYAEYAQQLEYLVFLKMADEYTNPPFDLPSIVPPEFDWHSLMSKGGQELLDHYEDTIRALRTEDGLAGQVFKSAENKIKDPTKLKHWIELINEGTWAPKGEKSSSHSDQGD